MPADQSKQPAIAQPFRHSRMLQATLGVCTILFSGGSAASLLAAPENGGGLSWPFLVFALFSIGSGWSLWHILCRYQIDSDGITQHRLGSTHQLRWSEVRQVGHRPLSNCLLLQSDSVRLRIPRHLKDFLSLVEAVERFVPTSALPPRLELPFSVPASWTLSILLGVVSIVLLAVGTYSLATQPDWATAAVLFGLPLLNAGIFAWEVPLRYEFSLDAVRKVHLARTIEHPTSTLNHAILSQRDLAIVLLLQFDEKSIELGDNQVLLPPERVYEAIVRAYRLEGS